MNLVNLIQSSVPDYMIKVPNLSAELQGLLAEAAQTPSCPAPVLDWITRLLSEGSCYHPAYDNTLMHGAGQGWTYFLVSVYWALVHEAGGTNFSDDVMYAANKSDAVRRLRRLQQQQQR